MGSRRGKALGRGSGSLHDNFILRQRLVDNTWASRPPRIERERLPRPDLEQERGGNGEAVGTNHHVPPRRNNSKGVTTLESIHGTRVE